MDDDGFQAQKEDNSGHFWTRWLAGPPKTAATRMPNRRGPAGEGSAAGAYDAVSPVISGGQFSALAFEQELRLRNLQAARVQSLEQQHHILSVCSNWQLSKCTQSAQPPSHLEAFGSLHMPMQ